MVERTFAAFDNEAFTVISGGPNNPPGSGIINNSDTPRGTTFTFSDTSPYRPITLDDTSGDPDVFEDDQANGHRIVDGNGLVADGTRVEAESFHFVRQIDDDGNQTGPVIKITVFSQNGQTSNIWGMATDTPLIDGANYVKLSGSSSGSASYDEFVPCFTPGSLVATSAGLIPAGEVRVGTRVVTRDDGMQTVRWVGTRHLSTADLILRDRLRPVWLAAGSLGHGLPERDMVVSPNHRFLMTGSRVALATGGAEALAAAQFLEDGAGIRRLAPRDTTYVHFMFDRHQIVMADGAWSESFLPGDYTIGALDAVQRDEVLEIFPELRTAARGASAEAARQILRRREARLLV